MVKNKKIIIVGSGFGAIYATKALLRQKGITVTMISKSDKFTFIPLLHEVATGTLNIKDIEEKIADIFPNCLRHLHHTVTKIDPKAKKVFYDDKFVEYDMLVLATGSTTNFRGMKGSEYCYTLKNCDDAMKIKKALVKTQNISQLILVGAGYTSLELVFEIRQFLNQLKKYPEITMINAQEKLLPQVKARFRRVVENRLKKFDIEVLNNLKVMEIKKSSVILSDNSELNYDMCFYNAGVKPNLPEFTTDIVLEKDGRITVDDYLRIPYFPDIYCIGDIASAGPYATPYPTLAQVAVQEGTYVGKHILGKITHSFKFKSKGTLLSLGGWYAVGEVFGVLYQGKFIWWLWRTVYLFKFITVLQIKESMITWTKQIFSHRDCEV